MPKTFGFSVAKERAHETLKAAFESPVNFLDPPPRTETGSQSGA
jgi:hypothetical protein